MQIFAANTMWEKYPLRDRYDVVIIGAGVPRDDRQICEWSA